MEFRDRYGNHFWNLLINIGRKSHPSKINLNRKRGFGDYPVKGILQ
jgi:hypothetical protein